MDLYIYEEPQVFQTPDHRRYYEILLAADIKKGAEIIGEGVVRVVDGRKRPGWGAYFPQSKTTFLRSIDEVGYDVGRNSRMRS